jgi:hypothetical protein
MVFAGILFLIYSVQLVLLIRPRPESAASGQEPTKVEVQIEKLGYRYTSVLMVFLYLVLPSVTTVIFDVFACQDIESDSFLMSDFTINCSSDRYTV